MIAIGQSLVSRGFDVSISLAEPYRDLAIQAGMTANVVVESDDFANLLSDPLVWKPVRGARRIFRWAANDFAPNHLKWIGRHYQPGQTVLVSHPLDFASRIFRETHPLPLVDVHLAPSMLRTYDDPPRMTPFWFEHSRPAWLVRSAYRVVDAVMIDPVVRKPLQRLRSIDEPMLRRPLNEWWLSPDRILALYPEWFAPATKSFSPRLVHCGFPLSDGPQSDAFGSNTYRSVSRQPKQTLDPIVFTAGTVHHHAAEYFQMAVRICQRLQRSGVLLSTHAENIPRDLPSTVRWASYEPLGELLRDASAIVHHGGIGTTAAALSAGCPQIIRPMAFDQFDNAARVRRLGCGLECRKDSELESCLEKLLGDGDTANHCAATAARVRTMPAAVEIAVAAICDAVTTGTGMYDGAACSTALD